MKMHAFVKNHENHENALLLIFYRSELQKLQVKIQMKMFSGCHITNFLKYSRQSSGDVVNY